MTKEDIIRMIDKKGFQETIRFLSSNDLSDDDRKSLEKEHILVDGYPCLSLLNFLSQITL